MLHHDSQEFDNHFGAGPQQNLSFSTLLGIVDRFESITKNVHTHHG